MPYDSNTAAKAHPVGTIIAWYAKAGSVPQGWVVCDGTNNTPDLRGRFIRGVAELAGVGTVGGASSHHHSFTGITANPRNHPDGWNADGMNRNRAPQTTGLDHQHDFTGTTSDTEVLPPYVQVIYLMKV
jgi:hypothetical protein